MSNERYQKGIEKMREQLGPDADQYVEAIREFAPWFAQVNVEFAFGDIYGEPNSPLDKKTRKLITIAALTTLGHSTPQLKVHLDGAKKMGVSKEEVVSVITQMIAYAGFPAATNALMAAKEIFSD